MFFFYQPRPRDASNFQIYKKLILNHYFKNIFIWKKLYASNIGFRATILLGKDIFTLQF